MFVFVRLRNCLGNSVIKPYGSKTNNIIGSIAHNNELLTDSMHKANAFNSYFSSIGRSIVGRINCEPDDHKKNYLSGNYPGSFFISPVSERDVYRIIISLKNKSSSCDNISVKVLKAISGAILPILTKLINK